MNEAEKMTLVINEEKTDAIVVKRISHQDSGEKCKQNTINLKE